MMKWRLLMIDVCSPPQSTLNWTMFTISANISTINNAFQKSSKNVECGQTWSHRLTDSSDWRNKCYLSINVLIYIKTEEFKELFRWKNVDRRDRAIKTSNVPSSREERWWRKVLLFSSQLLDQLMYAECFDIVIQSGQQDLSPSQHQITCNKLIFKSLH